MNILSLSGLELRKALYSLKGWRVLPYKSIEGMTLYKIDGSRGSVRTSISGWASEDDAWEQTPLLRIDHTFPLVLEMNGMGYEVEFGARLNKEGKTFFLVWLHGQGKTQLIYSDSETDPSDAIAKAYLLVKRESEKCMDTIPCSTRQRQATKYALKWMKEMGL